MHVFIWHKWKGMLTWNRSLKMKHLKKKGRNIWIDAINTMLWLSHACITKKYMIAIIAICPVSRYQTKSCFTVLRIDILPYDEMLQLMNTWNVILYLIDFSINRYLSYMNLLNVILRMISDLTNAWFVFTT